MTVLAVDASSRQRTVCVEATAEGELVRSEVCREESVGAALPRLLGALLHDGVQQLVAVLGPGSYTGLRAGLAALAGVAQARSLPMHGVGTLDVVAAGCDPGAPPAAVAVDAGRGAVYMAACTVRDGAVVAAPPRRALVDALAAEGPVASTDALPRVVLPVASDAALARAVPRALATPPLRLNGLRIIRVEEQ